MATTAQPVMSPAILQGVQVDAMYSDTLAYLAQSHRISGYQEGGIKQYNSAISTQDTFPLLKSGILEELVIRFEGNLTLTPGTGTIASTSRWPYDMLQTVNFNANGQSNLIYASGLKLKMREFINDNTLTDRGAGGTSGRSIAGTNFLSGSCSYNEEQWGVNSGASALTGGTFPVSLQWVIPVCANNAEMIGAIFMATQSVDIKVDLTYRPFAQLFNLTGNATAALNGQFTLESNKRNIPQVGQGILVPDLSTFHQFVQTPINVLANGGNEVMLPGQNGNKVLLRLMYQVYNGGVTSGAPLAMNTTNFGLMGWRYGTAENPDVAQDGNGMRRAVERRTGCDIGATWGLGLWDFNGYDTEAKDAIQEANISDLRLVLNVQPGVTLTQPTIEVCSETLFYGGQAA